MSKVQVKITRGVRISGEGVSAGQKIMVDDHFATQLIQSGKAIPVGGAVPKAENRDDDAAGGLTTKNAGDVVPGKKAKKA